MTFVLPEPTSEKWKHSLAEMIRCTKAFCFSVGLI